MKRYESGNRRSITIGELKKGLGLRRIRKELRHTRTRTRSEYEEG